MQSNRKEFLAKLAKLIEEYEEAHDNALTVGAYVSFSDDNDNQNIYEYNGTEFHYRENLIVFVKEKE